MKSPDGVLIKFWGKSKVIFTVKALLYGIYGWKVWRIWLGITPTRVVFVTSLSSESPLPLQSVRLPGHRVRQIWQNWRIRPRWPVQSELLWHLPCTFCRLSLGLTLEITIENEPLCDMLHSFLWNSHSLLKHRRSELRSTNKAISNHIKIPTLLTSS